MGSYSIQTPLLPFTAIHGVRKIAAPAVDFAGVLRPGEGSITLFEFWLDSSQMSADRTE